MHREHMFGADPGAAELLSKIVADLTSALRDESPNAPAIGAATVRAEDAVASLINDGDPRVRAQARGVAAVLTLLNEGDVSQALELLDEELLRSFPGRADLSGVRGLLEDI